MSELLNLLAEKNVQLAQAAIDADELGELREKVRMAKEVMARYFGRYDITADEAVRKIRLRSNGLPRPARCANL